MKTAPDLSSPGEGMGAGVLTRSQRGTPPPHDLLVSGVTDPLITSICFYLAYLQRHLLLAYVRHHADA